MDAEQKWLADRIAQSKRAVFFTGAGLSTESGIPDFRSPGGLWQRLKPIEFDAFLSCEPTRIEFWKRKFELDQTLAGARPNRGHLALAKLARQRRTARIITQNIDNLHQDSGLAPEQIIELHGNSTYAHCLSCTLRHELDWIRERFEHAQKPPPCISCGGLLKTATISFGQAMPEQAMVLAEQASLDCELFLSIGSSLQVYPAAMLPQIAKQNGALLAILNREPTELDTLADRVVHQEIGPALEAVAAAVS